MALAIGTYDPKAGIAGEIRDSMEAQFGAAADVASAEKLTLALAGAIYRILTGTSVYPSANASTSTPNATAGAATLPGSIV